MAFKFVSQNVSPFLTTKAVYAFPHLGVFTWMFHRLHKLIRFPLKSRSCFKLFLTCSLLQKKCNHHPPRSQTRVWFLLTVLFVICSPSLHLFPSLVLLLFYFRHLLVECSSLTTCISSPCLTLVSTI